MGEEGRVYGTPYLVRDIEMTCRQLILDHGDAGEDSVGTDVAIKHLAPTLLGMSVEITATVAAVDGRKITFEISAKDNLEQICSGTHGRFVVDVNKTVERLKAKAAKLASVTSG
ncbi:MAG: LysR family transcriptional regulator [Pseudolabrys sp.]|nr:LysR family transcriptional regulator [Pseudolabrys sp.]